MKLFISCLPVSVHLVLPSVEPKEGRVERKRKARPSLVSLAGMKDKSACADKSPPWRPCACSSSSHPKLSIPCRIACVGSFFVSYLQSCPSAEPTAWNIDPVLVCQTIRLSALQTLPKNSFQGDIVQLWADCQDLIIRSCMQMFEPQ